MKVGSRRVVVGSAAAVGTLVTIGIVAPFVSAQRFGEAIRSGLELSLHRKVEIGAAHFDLFEGPGFSIESVVIHEDPALGAEPVAYVETMDAVPRLSALLRGRLEFASVRLENAQINLVKSGPASDPGQWNFEPLLRRRKRGSLPAIHVRSGRINFKFGDTKSVFYLIDTDLDITPPWRWGNYWSVSFAGQPARTDRPARGFGSFSASGRWMPGGKTGKLDLDVELERSNVAEVITLLRGEGAGIHGEVSANMHLAGPLDDIRINGRVRIADVHRWDLLPPEGEGWPLGLQGRLNLISQKLELVSSSSDNRILPLTVRFRVSEYLSQPHWGVSLYWNHFPMGPVLELARHMGASVPPGLKLEGTFDGALGYEGQGGLQGSLAFHDTAVTIPDSPPIRFGEASMVFEHGHARLMPAVVRTSEEEEAQLEADYRWAEQAFDLDISTASMHVTALRSQVALASVPWLEQVRSGVWSGKLHYERCGSGVPVCPQDGWTGRLVLKDASFPVPGVESPLELDSANARIHGPRVLLDHIVGRVGKVAVRGEYRYEPQFPHPHRVRLDLDEVNAADLEAALQPTLVRSRSLLARALFFRRAPVPEWLRGRHVEGSVQARALTLGGYRLEKFKARLTWDVTRVEFSDVQTRVAGGSMSARLTVNLRGASPAYHMVARLQGVPWRSGRMDCDGTLDTSGSGTQLLANLRAKGAFGARLLDLEGMPPMKTVSGEYNLAWTAAGPHVTLDDLQLSSGGDTYNGTGATQPDGSLLIQLSSGSKEMRVTGSLAKLRFESAPPLRPRPAGPKVIE